MNSKLNFCLKYGTRALFSFFIIFSSLNIDTKICPNATQSRKSTESRNFYSHKASGQFCYLTTVFNEYETIRPPPTLPSDWLTFYVTDDSKTAAAAMQCGWNHSISLDQNYYRSPNFRFRLTMIAIGRIWPDRLVDLSMCDYLAFTDGNVARLDAVYHDWVKASAASGAALSLLNGWYFGARDSALGEELEASIRQKRWASDAEAMIARKTYYEAALTAHFGNSSLENVVVISAKYIVWNLKHPQRHKVAEWIATEYSIHLQGNIILSVAAHIFPDLIWVKSYSADFPFKVALASHAHQP